MASKIFSSICRGVHVRSFTDFGQWEHPKWTVLQLVPEVLHTVTVWEQTLTRAWFTIEQGIRGIGPGGAPQIKKKLYTNFMLQQSSLVHLRSVRSMGPPYDTLAWGPQACKSGPGPLWIIFYLYKYSL